MHAVREVLARRPEDALELWLLDSDENPRLLELLTLARQQGLAARRVPRRTLERLTGGLQHQGVVLRCRPGPVLDESDLKVLLAGFEDRVPAPLLLVLEGVQDPHNLGACLRSSDAAGVDAVIIGRREAVGLTEAVEKVACGAAVPLIQVGNLARTLGRLKEAGLWLVGTAPEAGTSLYECDLRGPTALLLGGEARGLRRLSRELCDRLIHIPMRGRVQSLNLSVAAAVCLYEALRQRTPAV